MAFDSTEYKNSFARQNYDRLLVTLPKGKKALLKEEASARGESVNTLIVRALEKCYKLDLSKD